jgi:hypothetical protein
MILGEETNFTYTGAFTTGSQFLINQLTGNPTGGVLFEVKAADTDVEVARFGDGTNYASISQGGVISFGGTGSLTLANDQVVMDNLDEDATFTDWVEDWKWTFDAADEEIEIINTAEYGANGQQVLIQNQDADVGAQMYLLDLDYSADDGQANADYIIAQDSGGTVWVLGQDGDVATTDGDFVSTNGAVTAGAVTDGTVTLVGDGTITGVSVGGLPDNIVDNGMMADNAIDSDDYVDASIDEPHLNVTNSPTDNYVLSYNEAGTNFTWVEMSEGGTDDQTLADLSEGADANDLDISVDKLEGVDAAVYIDLGADGVVEIEADGSIQLNSDVTIGEDDDIQLSDDNAIELDATADGMDDDEYNGIVIGGRNCGENLTQWDTVFLNNDADPWHQADADAAGEFPAFGLSVAACTDGKRGTDSCKRHCKKRRLDRPYPRRCNLSVGYCGWCYRNRPVYFR